MQQGSLACHGCAKVRANCAGAGTFEAAHITLTGGVWLGTGEATAEQLAKQLDRVRDRRGETVPDSGAAQGSNEVAKAMANRRQG